MARPTKFKEEYIEEAEKYLAINVDEINPETNKIRVRLPTVEGFAMYLGVNKTTLYEWEKVNEAFSNALDKIRIEQKQRLLNSGLSNDYNSTIAKLILSSNHGMNEKTEVDQNVKGNISLTDLFNKSQKDD